MRSLVSICIPTRNRPELLAEAIESCLAQTHREIEILVGDDSTNDETGRVVAGFRNEPSVRYLPNQSPLGQAGNVNRLFDSAAGLLSVLLHDDDLLLPRAVEVLVRGLDSAPGSVVCFGKQFIINYDGSVDLAASEELNETFHRTAAHNGPIPSAMWAAINQQLPGNGWLMLTEAARSVRLSSSPDVGVVCDFEFGLRLAAQYPRFVFMDEYVYKYRRTPVSISQGNNCSIPTYRLLQSLSLPRELEGTRRARLQFFAPSVTSHALDTGNPALAKRVYVSRDYPLRARFSFTGLAHLVLLTLPPATLQRLGRLRRVFRSWRAHWRAVTRSLAKSIPSSR